MSGTFCDPWETAKQRFTEDLTDEEKKQFNSVRIDEVLYSASAAQKRAQRDSKTWYMASKLMPLVEAIHQYGSALDVISNTQSGILCPLWGGIRVVLVIAESFGKYHDKLLDMFERIGDVLPRFSSYAKLFPNESYLLHALSMVYLDVLQFCAAAKVVFVTGRNSKIDEKKLKILPSSWKTLMKLLWKPFESQFGIYMENFRRHKANVEREAGLSHMIEASRERAAQAEERRLQQAERSIVRQQRIDQEKRRKEKRWLFILSNISAYNYDKKLKQSRDTRHQGTCVWIKDCDQYKAWSTSQQSAVLWVHGKAGSGKTILSGWIYENQVETVKVIDKAICLSYLCDFKQDDSLHPTTMVRSLIKQMIISLGRDKTPESILEELEILVQQGDSMNIDDSVEIFFRLCRVFKSVRLIIDGIDECDTKSQNQILRWIAQAGGFQDSILFICVLSRNDLGIKDRLKRYPTITLAESQPASDLSSYVAEQVNILKANGSLKFTNANLYDKVIEKLTVKADAMFLWVSLQLKDICDCTTDLEVEEVIEHLPQGLFETYERSLRRTFADCSNLKLQLKTKRVYSWVYHAKRPLTITELMEAIAIDPGDKSFNESKIATRELRWKVIKQCGSLLEFNETEETITFFHYTLKQYIAEMAKSNDDTISGTESTQISMIARSIYHSEDTIAGICVTYLSFSDFETAIVPFKKSPVNDHMQRIQEYTSSLATPSLYDSQIGRGLRSMIRGFQLLNGFFDEKQVPNTKVDYAKYIYEPEQPSPSFLVRYKMLDYVKSYWHSHCQALNLDSLVSQKSLYENLVNLCFYRELSFEIRPWGRRYSKGQYPYTDAFVWAVEKGHCLLLDLIYAQVDSKDMNHYMNLKLQDGSTLAHIAASHQTSGTLQRLAKNVSRHLSEDEANRFFVQADSWGRNLWHIAAMSGSIQVAEYLHQSTNLSPLANTSRIPLSGGLDIYGNTPFDYAIESRSIIIIKLLIDKGYTYQYIQQAKPPGWNIDGHSTHKLERLFLLICSTDSIRIMNYFDPLLAKWIHKCFRTNKSIQEGFETALENGQCFFIELLFKLFLSSNINGWDPSPNYATLEPTERQLVKTAFEIAASQQDIRLGNFLSEHFKDFSPSIFLELFENFYTRKPIDYEKLKFMASIRPSPIVVPAFQTPNFELRNKKHGDFEIRIPQSLGSETQTFAESLHEALFSFDASALQAFLSKTLRSGYRLVIEESIWHFFWQNLLILLKVQMEMPYVTRGLNPRLLTQYQGSEYLARLGLTLLCLHFKGLLELSLDASDGEFNYFASFFWGIILTIGRIQRDDQSFSNTESFERKMKLLKIQKKLFEVLLEAIPFARPTDLANAASGVFRDLDGWMPSRSLLSELSQLVKRYRISHTRNIKDPQSIDLDDSLLELTEVADRASEKIISAISDSTHVHFTPEEYMNHGYIMDLSLYTPSLLQAILQRAFQMAHLHLIGLKKNDFSGEDDDIIHQLKLRSRLPNLDEALVQNCMILEKSNSHKYQQKAYSCMKILIAGSANPTYVTYVPDSYQLKFPKESSATTIIQGSNMAETAKSRILQLFRNCRKIQAYKDLGLRLSPTTTQLLDPANDTGFWKARMMAVESLDARARITIGTSKVLDAKSNTTTLTSAASVSQDIGLCHDIKGTMLLFSAHHNLQSGPRNTGGKI